MNAPGSPPWSRAAAPVWALVSGYAPRVRGEKLLAFLQAFADDSASERGDKRLFIAGYLNRAEHWALFAEAWDEELRSAPTIEYLKMSEANNLGGQFRGWTKEARDEKLRGLARVIRHFKPWSFETSVSRDQYYRLVKPVAPRGIGNPHFVCTFSFVTGVARYAESQGIKSPIEFVFDEQSGVSDDIRLFFTDMIKQLPRGARNLISGTPTFKNDKSFLPLQAADMLAWHIRRERERGENRLPMAGLLRRAEGHVVYEIPDSTIVSWSAKFSKMPGISQLQSKGQWQEHKKLMDHLLSLGFVPPYGTKWKNALHRMRERVAKFTRS